MELIVIGILGLCLGSFLNVCIYRIPQGQSIVFPPSSCRTCGGKIPGLYLIPVFGYLISKGKCFNCKEKISIQYPLAEIFGAALAIVIYLFTDSILQAITFYNFIMVLLAITIIDIDSMIIPDQFIIYLILTAIPYIIYNKFYSNLLMALGLGLLFLAISTISRGGMGGGDIKLAFVMGLYLGFPLGLLAVFLGFLSGGIIGILLIFKGDSGKNSIPFAP